MIAPENKPLDVRNVSESSVPSTDGKKMRVPPSERKDFSRIYEEKEEKKGVSKSKKSSASEDTEITSAGEESEVGEEKKLPPVSSLFSKTGSDTKQNDSEMGGQNQPATTTTKKEDSTTTTKKANSPFSLFKQESANKKSPGWEPMAHEGTDVPVFATGDSGLQPKQKITTRFDQEQTELPHVNLMASNQLPLAASVGEQPKIQPTNIGHLKALVDQIVDKLYTLETSGKTDTILVLKHPPMFAGAQIVITEFKSATKEFNLAFENLRPDAKHLIDGNLESLRTAILEKGYTQAVHIITTTTYVEHTIPGDQQLAKDRDQQGQQQQQRQQQQEPEEEA